MKSVIGLAQPIARSIALYIQHQFTLIPHTFLSVLLPSVSRTHLGYIRDTAGLENLFQRKTDIYTPADFAHYGGIIAKLKATVMETFSISDLFFTAPTFITRLDGNSSWAPEGNSRILLMLSDLTIYMSSL